MLHAARGCCALLLLGALSVLPARGGDVKARVEAYLPDYSFYHNITQTQRHVDAFLSRHGGLVHLYDTFVSREGRPIAVLKLEDPSKSPQALKRKLRVLLSYGEHAREFITVESCFALLQMVVDGCAAARDESPESHFAHTLMEHFEVFMVPMLNPDGRAIVEAQDNYCWRGTAAGVDLNRNFDWEFGGPGSSSDPMDEEYRGKKAFSEPECNALLQVTERIKFDAFISFHSGIRHIYVPFADSVSRVSGRSPPEEALMLALANSMAGGLEGFIAGRASHLNAYPADGTIFDYMAGARHIPVSLAVEMWGIGDSPTLQCFDLFNPRSEDLHATLAQLHPLYLRFFQGLLDRYAPAAGLLHAAGKGMVRMGVPAPASTGGGAGGAGGGVSADTLSELESSQLSFATRLRFTGVLACTLLVVGASVAYRRRLRSLFRCCKRNPHVIALSRLGEDVSGYA